MKNYEFKITPEIIKAAELTKKYAGFFRDYPEDPDYILISKKFPLPELEDEELRWLLSIFFSIKE